MYCNENKNLYRNVTFISTVLFRLKHCFFVRLQEVILDLADPK